MKKEEIYDYLYARIENCCSISWLIKEITKYKELDDEDDEKIIRYWMSFK